MSEEKSAVSDTIAKKLEELKALDVREVHDWRSGDGKRILEYRPKDDSKKSDFHGFVMLQAPNGQAIPMEFNMPPDVTTVELAMLAMDRETPKAVKHFIQEQELAAARQRLLVHTHGRRG